MKKILYTVLGLIVSSKTNGKKAPTPAALISELNFLEQMVAEHQKSMSIISLTSETDLVLFDSEEFDNELRNRQIKRMEWWNVNAPQVFETELKEIGDNLLV